MDRNAVPLDADNAGLFPLTGLWGRIAPCAADELLAGGAGAPADLSDVLGFAGRTELRSVLDKTIMDARSSDAKRLVFKPMLLAGPPGVGRTHVARRVARLAGLPHVAIAMDEEDGPCLFGCDVRGPDVRLPSVLTVAIAASGCRNIVASVSGVDEMDWDRQAAFAAMIDPRGASSWIDPGLRRMVDLSGVSWFVQSDKPDALAPVLRSMIETVRLTWPDGIDEELHVIEVIAEAASDLEASGVVIASAYPDLDHRLARMTQQRSTARIYASAVTRLTEAADEIQNVEED